MAIFNLGWTAGKAGGLFCAGWVLTLAGGAGPAFRLVIAPAALLPLLFLARFLTEPAVAKDSAKDSAKAPAGSRPDSEAGRVPEASAAREARAEGETRTGFNEAEA